MTKSEIELTQAANKLYKKAAFYKDLLNDLQLESANITSNEAKQKFDRRFKILMDMYNSIVEYDGAVKDYIVHHPQEYSVKYYRDKLAIAKKYIEANNLCWTAVLWGKISDYKR